ncbi:MAG: hypothetical protein AAF962_27670 [Actinomycetota bacterium]
MSNPLSPTPEEAHDPGRLRPLYRLAAYAFVLQGVIFVAITILLPLNLDFFEAPDDNDWSKFLTDLDADPTQFLIVKALFLALRTLYGISLVGMAYIWWSRHRSAAILVLSFILVSIPMINTAQLMGMALVPLAGDYTAAAAIGDVATMASIEATASTVFTIADYLDVFVNVVPFVGLLASMFWLSTRVDGLERIKWILPLLCVLPFSAFVDVVAINLVASLLNVVATGAYFFLMAWFMLRTQPERPTEAPTRHD